MLGTDVGEGAGPNFRFYVQRTDGSPAVWLGDGDGQALSPDGRLALAVLTHAQPQQPIVVPLGAGDSHTLRTRRRRDVSESGLGPQRPAGRLLGRRQAGIATCVRSGRRGGTAEGGDAGWSGSRQDREASLTRRPASRGHRPRRRARPLSLDRRRAGRHPRPGRRRCGSLLDTGRPCPDGGALRKNGPPPRVRRVDIVSGRAQPWNGHTVPSGAISQVRILVTPDGESYAYNYHRDQVDLWAVSKLR